MMQLNLFADAPPDAVLVDAPPDHRRPSKTPLPPWVHPDSAPPMPARPVRCPAPLDQDYIGLAPSGALLTASPAARTNEPPRPALRQQARPGSFCTARPAHSASTVAAVLTCGDFPTAGADLLPADAPRHRLKRWPRVPYCAPQAGSITCCCRAAPLNIHDHDGADRHDAPECQVFTRCCHPICWPTTSGPGPEPSVCAVSRLPPSSPPRSHQPLKSARSRIAFRRRLGL